MSLRFKILIGIYAISLVSGCSKNNAAHNLESTKLTESYTSNDLNGRPLSTEYKDDQEVIQINTATILPENPDIHRLNILNDEIADSYSELYSLNPTTFFRDTYYKISIAAESLQSTEAKLAIKEFSAHYKLNNFSGPDRNTIKRLVKFNRQFQLAKTGALSELPNLDKYQFILVAGWGNEGFRKTYFEDLADSIANDFKVPKDQIYKFFPNSFDIVENNANNLDLVIKELKTKDKPIVLIGHSMGGNVILQLLIQNQNFLSNELAAAYIIQSPLKGTETARVAHGLKSYLPFTNGKQTGAYSMLSENTHKVMINFTKTIDPETRASFDKKVFYVSTTSFREKTKLGTYLMSEANDGTVPTEGTYFKTYGQRLADLNDIGHTDLFLSGYKSNLTKKERQAFAQTLLLSFFEHQQ